jgi:hypothetical protein
MLPVRNLFEKPSGCRLPADPGDPAWLFSSFFLEFFPPDFDDRLVARSH